MLSTPQVLSVSTCNSSPVLTNHFKAALRIWLHFAEIFDLMLCVLLYSALSWIANELAETSNFVPFFLGNLTACANELHVSLVSNSREYQSIYCTNLYINNLQST